MHTLCAAFRRLFPLFFASGMHQIGHNSLPLQCHSAAARGQRPRTRPQDGPDGGAKRPIPQGETARTGAQNGPPAQQPGRQGVAGRPGGGAAAHKNHNDSQEMKTENVHLTYFSATYTTRKGGPGRGREAARPARRARHNGLGPDGRRGPRPRRRRSRGSRAGVRRPCAGDGRRRAATLQGRRNAGRGPVRVRQPGLRRRAARAVRHTVGPGLRGHRRRGLRGPPLHIHPDSRRQARRG